MANTPKEKLYSESIDCTKFTDFLISQKTVKIAGLGTFSITYKKSYTGYLPKSGERKVVDGGIRITFRPYRQLKQALKTHGENIHTRTQA